jgi:hypothetical protein
MKLIMATTSHLFVEMAFFVLIFLVFCSNSLISAAVLAKGSLPTKVVAPLDSFNITIVTWNLAEKKVSDADCSFLKSYRNGDIVVFGVQECENIKPRREEGHRSRAWRSIQRSALGKSFECLAEHKMGGLQIAVYAKKKIANQIQGLQVLDVACGIGNVLANKGAVCVLLRVKGKTLALVNAHLAAHKGKVRIV